MSQKAWMNAYTKGSKSLQARLSKIHANNPEFQDFVKKHGFGNTLSVKQSEKQKTHSVGTVKPVTDPHPEMKMGPEDRLAIIKAKGDQIMNRRREAANRVAFGGELGGGFQMPHSSFRRYSEALDYKGLKRLAKPATKAEREYMKNQSPEDRERFERIRKHFSKRANLAYMGGKKVNEAREYKKGDKVMLNRDYAGQHAGLIFTVHHTNDNGEHWIGRGPSHSGWYVRPNQIRPWKRIQATDEGYYGNTNFVTYVHKKDKESHDAWMDSEGFGPQKVSKHGKNHFKYTWKDNIEHTYSTDGGGKESVKEETHFGDASYTMRRGGWVVKRNGKIASAVLPSETHAKDFINSTRMTLGRKVAEVG
jgi:hypothetical protein